MARPAAIAGSRIDAVSPIDGAHLGSVAVTDPADVARVVAEAAEVQQLWAQLRRSDRAREISRAPRRP